ncbi:MAG: hypothetical protein IIV87_01100 [Oscillospiraceae bacterium]|nr:hypothetical protein [Oscillospiraceae bacterium]
MAMAQTKKPKGKKLSDQEKIRRQLRKMAFGKANDCVKLAMCEGVDIRKLDLSMLKELHKGEKTVDIKLVDRLEILRQLATLGEEDSERMDEVLAALGGGEDEK